MIGEKSHYDDAYFSWQKDIGEFGGWANLTKFSAYISQNDNVVDFGCGGGFLLSRIRCAKKLGVEINPEARRNALGLGITAYEKIQELPDAWADVIISNNALEHVFAPFDAVQQLFLKVRPGGKVIFVVPCESFKNPYVPGDINQHLYSWNPMLLGNLFVSAGFKIIEVAPYRHKWPPYYRKIAHFWGRKGFELSCKVFGWIKCDLVQIRIIALRPE